MINLALSDQFEIENRLKSSFEQSIKASLFPTVGAMVVLAGVRAAAVTTLVHIP